MHCLLITSIWSKAFSNPTCPSHLISIKLNWKWVGKHPLEWGKFCQNYTKLIVHFNWLFEWFLLHTQCHAPATLDLWSFMANGTLQAACTLKNIWCLWHLKTSSVPGEEPCLSCSGGYCVQKYAGIWSVVCFYWCIANWIIISPVSAFEVILAHFPAIFDRLVAITDIRNFSREFHVYFCTGWYRRLACCYYKIWCSGSFCCYWICWCWWVNSGWGWWWWWWWRLYGTKAIPST